MLTSQLATQYIFWPLQIKEARLPRPPYQYLIGCSSMTLQRALMQAVGWETSNGCARCSLTSAKPFSSVWQLGNTMILQSPCCIQQSNVHPITHNHIMKVGTIIWNVYCIHAYYVANLVFSHDHAKYMLLNK